MTQQPYAVFACPFSGSRENRREIGEFPTSEAALNAASAQVINDLWAVFSAGQSAKELFDLWSTLGDDVSIVPDDEIAPFSATNLARFLVLQITEDGSRPLYLEVTCTDRLNFSSSFTSPPRQWIFWVKAPATYSGATVPMRRAVEFLYHDMSRKALDSEGSSYTLVDMTMRELNESEVAQQSQSPHRKTIFVVQGDGSLVAEAASPSG